ncbi:MAG: efflux RND transporter periplasmic adaptor subunit [Dethiobacter sp.]|nr:MAG: efflux RND transporter periplasmic adaptor subunit [Dethiobacter sp.]
MEKAHLDLLLAEMDLEQMLNPDVEDAEELSVETARLKVEEAKLALESKLSLLPKLEVTTPISGQVDFHVSTGEEVTSGSLLATVFTPADLLVKLQVSELRLSEAQVRQEVRVYIPAAGRTYDGIIHEIAREGTVKQTSPDVSELTYFTVTVKADFDDKVKAGMSAAVSIVYEVEDMEDEIISINLGRGNTYYADTQEIRADVAGKVTKMTVEDGMPVREGMPLMWLQNADLDHQIRQARVALAQAENNLERLLNPEPKTYTDADLEKQRIKVEQARLNLQSQLNKLRDMQITAPVSGRVMEVAVEAGSNVSPKDLLVTIADYSRMKLVLSIDELDVVKIIPGQEAIITVDALPGKQYRGTVISIASEGSIQGDITSYDVTLEILEPEGLMAGMRATATIIINDLQDVLVLPTEAVTFEAGARRGIVEVLIDGKMERRPVEIGLVGTRYLEIKSGIAEGDQVVITGTVSSTTSRIPGMIPGMTPGVPGSPGGGTGIPGGGGGRGGTR